MSERTRARRNAFVLAVGALLFGIADALIISGSNHVTSRGAQAALVLFTGWSFVGVGLLAHLRRPDNRIGLLMVAAGYTWLLLGLVASDEPWVFAVGATLSPLPYALVFHLMLAFPGGRLQTRLARALAAAVYFDVTVMQFLTAPFINVQRSEYHCEGCPESPIMIGSGDTDVVFILHAVQTAIAVVAITGFVVILRRRWIEAGPALRRSLVPVLVVGGTAFILEGLSLLADLAGANGLGSGLQLLTIFAVAGVPYAFLLGLLRARFGRATAVSDVLEGLEQPAIALQAVLADALGDPTVAVAYWMADEERWIDEAGEAVVLPGQGDPLRAVAPVERQGVRIGALVHDAELREDPELVRGVIAAAALAMENQRLHAELRARVAELRASRTRIVEAGLDERRRLERNLHDGAQQRLVSLALSLRLAQDRIDEDPRAARALLDEAVGELAEATEELRELARGIHPAVLTDRGLPIALQALATRAPLPVEVDAAACGRLAPPVESATYFVVAEALTNVARYAHASHARVSVSRENGDVRVEIADDGVGGADPEAGSGLRGLADRVAALDGRLHVDSPAGAGTTVIARIPCGS